MILSLIAFLHLDLGKRLCHLRLLGSNEQERFLVGRHSPLRTEISISEHLLGGKVVQLYELVYILVGSLYFLLALPRA